MPFWGDEESSAFWGEMSGTIGGEGRNVVPFWGDEESNALWGKVKSVVPLWGE